MIKKIVQNGKGTMVDVRTHEEFQNGHAANSVNIPLHELAKKISEVKKLKSPLVLCCASRRPCHTLNKKHFEFIPGIQLV